MRIIVISSPSRREGEISDIIALFESGLEYFHLRKPKMGMKEYEEFLINIPSKYHHRIVIHSYFNLAQKYNVKGIHLTSKHKKQAFKTWLRVKWLKFKKPHLTVSTSMHSLSKIKTHKDFEYVFLSPIFDSLSKKGHISQFDLNHLKNLFRDKDNIIALGGVDASKYEEIKNAGFGGLALLGAVWENEKRPHEVFTEIKDVVEGRFHAPKLDIQKVKIKI